MFNAINEIKIIIKNIPLQWISKIELYYPDLPQFPIQYIHSKLDGKRIIAIPIAVNYEIKNTDCNAEFTLLSNIDPKNHYLLDHIKAKLENRIGFSEKITKSDLATFNNKNSNVEIFLNDVWLYLEKSYGNTIPYGQFYEEIYSIVRFVSAWQPKTGRQSEMRMLYNFMSTFGEEITLPDKWSHLECYVIPNLDDIQENDFSSFFPKFSTLKNAMEKLFKEYYTKEIKLPNGQKFKGMKKAWPKNKDEFIKVVSLELFNANKINEAEKFSAEKLVDAFNRHPWRAAYFISSYMNIKTFSKWHKEQFNIFYQNGALLIGYSEKVIACFLQQGFNIKEAIPIDTWIETFYKFPLGIKEKKEFLNSYNNLGKLERIIWLSSQSNKTNMKNFIDILWCQRYGSIGNGTLRGINPIACSICKLKYNCIGLQSNLDTTITLYTKENVINPSTDYFCYIENGVPKKCYNKVQLIDEFSGYRLSSKDALPKHLIKKNIITMKEFLKF